MTSSVALQEARENLDELLERAERGEEIVIERDGRVGMRIMPVGRVGGQNLLGVRFVAANFDEPMTNQELQDWEG